MLTAPQLGKLADKVGSPKVMLVALIGAGILFIPQAYVTNTGQLMVLRFLLGIAVAGLLPSINTWLSKMCRILLLAGLLATISQPNF